MRFILLFISLLAQRNEPKKGHPVSLVPPRAGCPAFLDAAGALQTRYAQTVQSPFSAASPVLGRGQWDFNCMGIKGLTEIALAIRKKIKMHEGAR
jgi:hypothetical protein